MRIAGIRCAGETESDLGDRFGGVGQRTCKVLRRADVGERFVTPRVLPLPVSTSQSNFLWLLSERVLRAVIGLGVSVAVARHLGPQDFGTLSYAVAFTAIIGVLAGLGIDEILVQKMAAHPAKAADFLTGGWRLKRQAAWVAYGITLLAAWCWRPGETRAWGVVAIVAAGMLFSPADVIGLWFQSSERMRASVVAREIALLVSAALKMALVLAGASLWAFAAATAADLMLSAWALILVWRKERVSPRGASEQSIERELLARGWPLAVSGLLVMAVMQMDRLWLARVLGDTAAGVYSVAARVTEIFHAIPVTLGAALLPRLASLHARDPAACWRLARRATVGMLALTVGVAAVTSVSAGKVIPWLFGRHYEASAAVLTVHVWTLVLVGMVSLRSRLLIITGASRSVLLMSVATVALNSAGNVFFVPRFGPVGAAYSALLAWGASAGVLPWIFPSIRPTLRAWCGLGSEAREL